jgi:hypothetical protein
MIEKFYKRLAVSRLKRRYKYLIQVNLVMEAYQTNRILQGGSEEFKAQSRAQLVELQRDTREYENLVAFLSKVK